MKVTYPVSTSEGDEYLVLIEAIEKSTLPEEVIKMLGDINIMDITLERVSGGHITKPSVLFDISNCIAGFLLDNKNIILYFYCDDIHDIPRRDKSTTPQKYRSHLFSIMFDRYTSFHSVNNFINTTIEVKSDRDIYIHLIAKDIYLPYVNAIKNGIVDMSSK